MNWNSHLVSTRFDPVRLIYYNNNQIIIIIIIDFYLEMERIGTKQAKPNRSSILNLLRFSCMTIGTAGACVVV